MAFVITRSCCKDSSCVPVCPVDCIRPAGAPGEYTDSEMLYIDPDTCIDCGLCMEECPVDAIYSGENLPQDLERFRDINAEYFKRHPLQQYGEPLPEEHDPVEPGSLRVAIVGAGPAGCYNACELLFIDGVEVDMYERLPTPYGLIRGGVAPDHLNTKEIVDVFDGAFTDDRFACHLNVEVGRDLTHEDLMAHHHAVVYAVGAFHSRTLGIPGEELSGHHSATDFVAWYNGHPDFADQSFDLTHERAVIIGNGNVAIDVARMLLLEPDELAETDIADHALQALSQSNVKEVVILGRHAPRDAAYTLKEFLALAHLSGIDVVVESDYLEARPDDDIEFEMKVNAAREYAQREPSPENKRIVFRFLVSPVEIVGSDRVEGLRVVHNAVDESGAFVQGDPTGETELIETPLILRSIGHRGSRIEGLPFDEGRCIVPNDRGRVLGDDGEPLPGVYVTGWIKRGAHGVIGTNKTDAEETVARLWEDFDDGKLTSDIQDSASLQELVAQRDGEVIDWSGWRAIDAAERQRGEEASRPRVKFVDVAEMLAAAQSSASSR
jgi:ferredoxin/flavodoxin---NADP+ reductase